MTIKIHGLEGTVCTSRVLATLYEKDVTDFELLKVNMHAGEHKQPEFLKKQPFGVVPVLTDGSLSLFESRAIARFISHKFEGKGTPLYGTTPKDKALTEVWLEAESQNFNPVISEIVKEKVFKVWKGGQTDESAVAASVEKFNKVLDVYDAQLAKNKYLAGDFFSLADLSHLPYLDYLVTKANMGYLIESRPHVKAWWDDISSRPAWKKVPEFCLEK